MFAASVSQYRTFSLSYLNLERRFNYALQGYSQTQFFYGQLEGVFYDPSFSGIIDRDFAIATRTMRGGTAFGIWPFNRYRRVEVFGGMHAVQRELQRPGLDAESRATTRRSSSASRSVRNGTFVPFGVNYVQETTVFREFGPLSGNTVRARLRGRAEDRQHPVAPDRRRRRAVLPAHRRLGTAGAARARSSRAGARRPTSCTSAATPRCAATTTCRSWAARPRSSTPSCGSR